MYKPPLLICCLAAFGLALETAPALDLTPQSGVRVGNEGPPVPVVQFQDGKNKIDYQPPRGWLVSGGGNALSIFSSDTSEAWMKLIVIEKGSPQPQGGAAVANEDGQAWAAQFIPSGAEKREFVKMVPSPFTVGVRASSEFIFTFVLFGARDCISVSVVEYSKTERLVMLVSADSKSFGRIRQQAIASMFSWSSDG